MARRWWPKIVGAASSALKYVSFALEKGMVAVVDTTGAGKSHAGQLALAFLRLPPRLPVLGRPQYSRMLHTVAARPPGLRESGRLHLQRHHPGQLLASKSHFSSLWEAQRLGSELTPGLTEMLVETALV